ncbi:MAG: HEAT repeat domain-containing protein [Deltaproteobacteria bacterium]|nr:HEAT repeat domain-containing protein [Deltaproteobacteria bacterium]
MRPAVVVVAVALATARGASAQPSAEVADLIKLVETQPAGMDRSLWKEKRRDAARKLAASKDKRAVPVLIKIAEAEQFDIVGEIAIEGLGSLGDTSAVPALQRIANDSGRDQAQRELAKKSLTRLGAKFDPKAGTGGTGGTGGSGSGGSGTGGTGGSGTGGTGGSGSGGSGSGGSGSGGSGSGGSGSGGSGSGGSGSGGSGSGGGGTGSTGDGGDGGDDVGGPGKGNGGSGGNGGGGGTLFGDKASELPALPMLSDDTIAAYDRLTFAAGTSSLAYDTVRKRSSFDADIAAAYDKRVERQSMAWGWNARAHLTSGFINPEDRAQTRGVQINASGGGEARFYSGQLYGVMRGVAGFQVNYIADIAPMNPNNDVKDTRLTADVQIALGGGYGRLLDVGGGIRVRRLSRTLDKARALGKPIDAATARRLQLTWWALRGERSAWRSLVATVAILREAGILLGEPDAGLSFEILNVLRDSQLFLRPSGADFQLAIGEGFLRRPEDDASGQSGRVEQLLMSAGYGKQIADDLVELSGNAFARLRLFAPETQPSPYAVGFTGRMRRFSYGDHGDPFGILDVSATVLASNDNPLNDPDPETALRISGQLGFTYLLNQASGIRVAATVAQDGGQFFIGAQLSFTYGLLDGTFSGLGL